MMDNTNKQTSPFSDPSMAGGESTQNTSPQQGGGEEVSAFSPNSAPNAGGDGGTEPSQPALATASQPVTNNPPVSQPVNQPVSQPVQETPSAASTASVAEAPAPPDLNTAPKQKKERRGIGCNPFSILWKIITFPGKLIHAIFYLGCVLPTIIVVILILIVVFQPGFIWNPLKDIVNGDLTSTEYSQINSTEDEVDSLRNGIVERINSPETLTEVSVSELELAKLMSALVNTEQSFIDLNENEVSLLINLDADSPEEPLWLKLDFSETEGEIKLSSAKLGRIPLPAGLINSLQIPVVSDLLDRLGINEPRELLEIILNQTLLMESIKISDEQLLLGDVQLEERESEATPAPAETSPETQN